MLSADHRLVKSHLDLSNLHVQMTIGCLAVLILCLANYLSIVQCMPIFGLRQKLVCIDLLMVLQIIDFALYFISCLLTGFICLEITGRFGNRLGACCAIWSALLFSVFPLQVFFSLPWFRSGRLISILILLSVWLWLRLGAKKQFLGLLSLFVLLGLLFPLSFRAAKLSEDNWLNLGKILMMSYILALLSGVSRIVSNRFNYKILLIILFAVGTLIVGSHLPIEYCPLQIVNLTADGVWIIMIASASVIIISFCCLGALGNYRKDLIQMNSIWGLIALMIISTAFENLFTSCEGQIKASGYHQNFE